jgi:hypothetical protein
VVVNVEKNKTKCGLFAERGRRQSGHCRGLLAITLGNSGKIFPARVFPVLPSIVAMGSRQRIFFKKIKTPLFADGLCQGRSAQVVVGTTVDRSQYLIILKCGSFR